MAKVPDHLMRDRYWRGMLFLFSQHNKLNEVFTSKYFNFENETVKVAALRKAAQVWSGSEKFMLQLALHLFNERHKVNLSDMDRLDSYNKELAIEAIRRRFM